MQDISAALSKLCLTHRLDFEGADFEVDGRTLYVRNISASAADGIIWGRWEWEKEKVSGLTDDFDQIVVESEGMRPQTIFTQDCGRYLQRIQQRVQAVIDVTLKDGIYLPFDNDSLMTPKQLQRYVEDSSDLLVLTSMDTGRVIAVSEPYGIWTDRSPESWKADTGNLARWDQDSLAKTVNWLDTSNGLLSGHTTLGAHCVTGQMFEWECDIKLVHYGDVRCRMTKYYGRREANLAMV